MAAIMISCEIGLQIRSYHQRCVNYSTNYHQLSSLNTSDHRNHHQPDMDVDITHLLARLAPDTAKDLACSHYVIVDEDEAKKETFEEKEEKGITEIGRWPLTPFPPSRSQIATSGFGEL